VTLCRQAANTAASRSSMPGTSSSSNSGSTPEYVPVLDTSRTDPLHHARLGSQRPNAGIATSDQVAGQHETPDPL
jgi:hypothetical protein